MLNLILTRSTSSHDEVHEDDEGGKGDVLHIFIGPESNHWLCLSLTD